MRRRKNEPNSNPNYHNYLHHRHLSGADRKEAEMKYPVYEIIDAENHEVLFVGTEKEVDKWIENPDHNEIYEIRERRMPNANDGN